MGTIKNGSKVSGIKTNGLSAKGLICNGVKFWEKQEVIDSATVFLLATGITDSTQVSAINYLVNELKAKGIWDKLDVIYPFIGGTAFTHKFNLKNPVDSNLANRINFTTTNHNQFGISPATVQQLDFFYTQAQVHDFSLCMYSRTSVNSGNWDFNCTAYSTVTQLYGNNFIYSHYGSSSSFAVGSMSGFFQANKNEDKYFRLYRNGELKGEILKNAANQQVGNWGCSLQIRCIPHQ